MSDYLAVIFISGGSSHGRSPDKEQAIKHALRYFKDWESLFYIPAQDLEISIWDVEGFDQCQWDNRGMHGKRPGSDKYEDIAGPPEIIKRPWKPTKRKQRRA